jgi:hypothetical protein
VQYGGWIAFRHAPEMADASWPNSTSIGRAVNGDQTHVCKPGTYLGRAYDCDGRESTTTAQVSSKQASVLTFVTVDDLVEDPGFAGVKTNCELASGALQLATGDFDVADVDSLADWDSASSTVVPAGTYAFAAGNSS